MAGWRPENAGVVLISDRRLCLPTPDLLSALFERGIRGFFLREKDLTPRALYELALPLARHAHTLGLMFGVHASLEVALAVGADAVHLGHRALPLAAVRDVAAGRLQVGVSCHSLEDVVTARAGAADYVTLSPLFAPTSKTTTLPPLGLAVLSEAVSLGVPVLALGGIEPGNAAACREAGAHGLAAIGSVFGANDPLGQAERMVNAFGFS